MLRFPSNKALNDVEASPYSTSSPPNGKINREAIEAKLNSNTADPSISRNQADLPDVSSLFLSIYGRLKSDDVAERTFAAKFIKESKDPAIDLWLVVRGLRGDNANQSALSAEILIGTLAAVLRTARINTDDRKGLEDVLDFLDKSMKDLKRNSKLHPKEARMQMTHTLAVLQRSFPNDEKVLKASEKVAEFLSKHPPKLE